MGVLRGGSSSAPYARGTVKERSFRILLMARAQWDAAGAGSWAPSS